MNISMSIRKEELYVRIKMAGIDYRKAPVEVRERFSMTASAVERALQASKVNPGLTGCVIISTCNRTEYWISGETEAFDELDPAILLCEEKCQSHSEYKKYFQVSEGMEAVHGLMELCCGIRSQIFGDDQIISQVKRAVDMAREQQALDTALEILFRTAVTGAKKVKSRVLFSNVDRSVAGNHDESSGNGRNPGGQKALPGHWKRRDWAAGGSGAGEGWRRGFHDTAPV